MTIYEPVLEITDWVAKPLAPSPITSTLTPPAALPHPPQPPFQTTTIIGFFNEEELLIIADALEAQEQFLVSAKATKSTGAWGSIKSFFSNTYVQYIGLGLATALVLAVAVTLAVIVIKKMRASKADKQGTASQEEEKGLLQPYDAVV